MRPLNLWLKDNIFKIDLGRGAAIKAKFIE
jgi:hypothetical protein